MAKKSKYPDKFYTTPSVWRSSAQGEWPGGNIDAKSQRIIADSAGKYTCLTQHGWLDWPFICDTPSQARERAATCGYQVIVRFTGRPIFGHPRSAEVELYESPPLPPEPKSKPAPKKPLKARVTGILEPGHQHRSQRVRNYDNERFTVHHWRTVVDVDQGFVDLPTGVCLVSKWRSLTIWRVIQKFPRGGENHWYAEQYAKEYIAD